MNLVVVSLHGSGAEEAVKAKKAIVKASSNRQWVLLNNIHTSAKLLAELPTFLETLPPMENWRLWLSSHGDCHQLPVPILQWAYKVVLDSPLALRGSVLHCLSHTAGDLIAASARPEWLPIIHNMIMLHATLRLRKQAFEFAWAENYHWTLTHLMVSLIAEGDMARLIMFMDCAQSVCECLVSSCMQNLCLSMPYLMKYLLLLYMLCTYLHYELCIYYPWSECTPESDAIYTFACRIYLTTFKGISRSLRSLLLALVE